jgi:hypothetical protein
MSKSVFAMLGKRTGNIAIDDIQVEKWGGEVVVKCLYRYPPEETPFTLRFQQVRSIQWITVKMDSTDDVAQVLTHDIGEGGYKCTARFAMVQAEVVISYDSLTLEKSD